MTPFHLTVLGPPELRAPNGDPIRFRTRKHLALLVYLAVERPIAHRRDKLATLLWPNSAMEEARHSLATGLSLLRSRLGSDAFESGRESVRLLPGRVVTDLSTLEAQEGDSVLDTPLPSPFLDDFEIPSAPDYQLWCDAHRARCVPRLQSLLIARIEHARRQGDSRKLKGYADHLRQIDHLSEEATKAALEARAMTGDRIGALRVFDGWRNTLATELGASPSRALEQVAQRLRRDALPLTPHLSEGGDSEEAGVAPAYFGRSEEFAICHQEWERACKGAARQVLIRGAFGVGKSVFVHRFATALALEGAQTSIVRCYQAERDLRLSALGTIVEAVSRHVGALAMAPDKLAVLAQYLPLLHSRFPGVREAPHRGQTDEGMLGLGDAMIELLGSIASEHPTLVVVDDAQWMDPLSRSVMHHVIRNLEGTSAMFLLAWTDKAHGPECLNGDHRGTILLPEANVIALGPLSSTEAEEMAVHIVGDLHQHNRPALTALLACACGIPLAISELANDWRNSGKPDLTVSVLHMSRQGDSAPLGPYSLRLTHEFARLPQDTLVVAQFSALLGPRIEDLALYELVGVSVADAAKAFMTLMSRRILVALPTGLQFRDAITRERCYATLAPPIRRHLHSLVANALCAAPATKPCVHDLDVARHLWGAGRTKEATPLLTQGSCTSMRRGLPRLAEVALSNALHLSGAVDSNGLMLALAEAKQEMGQWAESLSLLDASQAHGDHLLTARVALVRAMNERFLGILVGARLEEATEKLLDIGESRDEPIDLRVRAISGSTALISSSRDKRHIERLGALTASLRLEPLNEYDSIHLAHGSAWFLAQSGGPRTALPVLLDGVATIDRTGYADSIVTRLLLGAGVTLCQIGRYREAAPLLRRAHSIASGLGNSALIANAASGVALVEGRLGNHSDQIEFAREAIRATGSEEWGICILSAAYDQGLGLAIAGRAHEAESAMSEFDSRFDKRRPAWVQQAWKLCKADVLALAGNERKALSAGRVGTSGSLKKLHHDCFAGQYARWVAFAGVRTGTAAGALARLERQIDTLDRHDAKDQAEILAAVAILERSMGRESDGKWAEVRAKLEQLPQPTQTMIRRLGLTQPNDVSGWGVRRLC